MITIIKNSLANLKGHKLRLAIAFIWIIIGITSVVFVSSIGNGLSEIFKTTFSSVKPRTSIVYFEYPNNDGSKSDKPMAYQAPLSQSDLGTLNSIDGIQTIETSNKALNISIFGEDSFMQDISFYGRSSSSNIVPDGKEKYKLLKGRSIDENDEGSRVIVIPSSTADEIFGKDVDPIGKGVSIRGLTFQVVGIANSKYYYDKIDNKFKKTGTFVKDFSYSIVPKSSYDILTGTNIKTGPINSLIVDIKDGYDMNKVNEEIIKDLKELHPNFKGKYLIQDRTSIQKDIDTFTQSIDKFIRIITIVAMIVGGVGIMNIMYVSVMERTKEIGIRRALGAKSQTILAQFLIESVFITSIGGIIGVIVGYAVTLNAQGMLPFKPIPSYNGFLYAVICIVVTGIIFGIVPAYKASKIDPIKVIYK